MKAILKRAAQSTVHAALAPIEAALLRQHGTKARWPHVFIVGAPRSGTSLFYELLVTRYRFAFFSNLAHRFWQTPVAVSRIGMRAINARTSAYRSDYGHISGWTAPNEGGWIWQRWLDDGPWVDERAVAGVPVQEMRSTLAAMESAFSAPFVNKNVMHANRIRLLDAIFPGCLFLEVYRSPRDTARSIVRAQRREKGPSLQTDAWWSVRPSNAKAGGNLVDRACLQVQGVAEDIERDVAHLGRDCHHRLDYAALCAEPRDVLDQVAAFLIARGVPSEPRAAIPSRFDITASSPLSVADEAQLDAAFGSHS